MESVSLDFLRNVMQRRRNAEMWRPKSCQWIDGIHTNPICGTPVVEGKPYCPAHAARAYKPAVAKGEEGDQIVLSSKGEGQ